MVRLCTSQSLVCLRLISSLAVNYTVANLLITDIFPKETQALAGAVYQTMSQLGMSIGIAVLSVISNTITDRTRLPDKESPEALMQGFRAVFWTCFAMMVLSTLVGMWGLRGWRKIGSDRQSGHDQDDTKNQSSKPDIKRPKPEIKRKSLPPGWNTRQLSSVRAKRLSLRSSRAKPLPEIPTGPDLPTFEVTCIDDAAVTLGLEDGAILDYILGAYDRSQESLVVPPRS